MECDTEIIKSNKLYPVIFSNKEKIRKTIVCNKQKRKFRKIANFRYQGRIN